MTAQAKIFTNLELLKQAKRTDADLYSDGTGYVCFELLGIGYSADLTFNDDYEYTVTRVQTDDEEVITDAQVLFVAECLIEQVLDERQARDTDQSAIDAYDDYLHSRAASQYEHSTGNLPAWA